MMKRLEFLRRLGLGAGLLAGGARLGAQGGAPRPSWPPPPAVGDDAFWAAVREQYAISEDPVYLNCGGLGPTARPVLDIMDVSARSLQYRVESGHSLFEIARGHVARFLGAEAREIAFTRNATEGNSIIAAGLKLRAGDEVIFESEAHPGGSLPWVNLARQAGVRLRIFRPDWSSAAGNLERIAALVTPATRVIQVSHVTAPTGLVFPVAAIARLAREKGIWFHIDGAQSAGMIPVNLRDIDCDSYATSGHKWLGAPRETGVLYLRSDRIDEVAPMHVGAYSSSDFDFAGQLVYTEGARRHEYGTRNAAEVVAVAEAVRFQETIGRERIAAHGAALAARVGDGLRALPGVRVLTPTERTLRASMVTFAVEGRAAGDVFGYLLEQHRLRCRPVTEDGLNAVRVSLHVFNTAEQGERVVGAVRRLVTP